MCCFCCSGSVSVVSYDWIVSFVIFNGVICIGDVVNDCDGIVKVLMLKDLDCGWFICR